MQLNENALVLYKNRPAVITEKKSSKYTLLLEDGKTCGAREKDVVLLFSQEDKNERSAAGVLKSGEACCPQFKTDSERAIQNAWELLDGAETNFVELCELIWSKPTYETAIPYWQAIAESIYFTGTPQKLVPRSESEIDAIVKKENERQEERQRRSLGLERLKNGLLDAREDSRILQEIESFALGKTQRAKILKDAGLTETPEAAHRLLLKTAYWPIEKNPFPERFGLPQSSASRPIDPPADEERLDLTGDDKYQAYAVDDAHSDDPDDAVCFDGEYLWIHIADPAASVTMDCPADIEARERGSTYYLPEGIRRMLSERALAYYALGLGETSLALSFRLSLDENCSIRDTAIYKTRIKVKRLTYEQADSMRGEPYMRPLFDIALRNIDRRKKNGAAFIDLPEARVSLTDGAVSVVPEKKYESNAMVREMMLLAGESAARFAFKREIPFQYVSQESPEIPEDLPAGLAGQYRLRRCMRPRQVGVAPAAHFGLGLGMYAQVTSPLRRYGDLVCHQQLRRFLAGEPLLDKYALMERISQGDAGAGAGIKADRASNLHWKLIYLLQNPLWRGEAIITDITQSAAAICVPSLAMESSIALQPGLSLNGSIQIRAGNVDIPKQSVDFFIAPPQENASE